MAFVSMTRNQWIVESREQRIKLRTLWLSKQATNFSAAINGFLKELYSHMYTDKQQAAINLVDRYKNKLDPEYVKRHERLVETWKPEAKERAREMFRSLIYRKNPFLAISKDPNPSKYFPIPIKYTPST